MVVHAHYPIGETRVQREALALVSAGFEVDVLCLRAEGEPARDKEDGVTIYRLPLRRHRGRGLFFQLLEYLAFFVLAFGTLIGLHTKKRYLTMQVHNLPDFLIFAALYPKLTGARLILDSHDLMPEFFAAKTGGNMSGWPVRLLIWQEQLSCRFADHVVSVTELWRDTLIARGVRADKISVVMNVADSQVFNQDNRIPAENNNRFGLIYHGTLTKRYGVDLVIRAVDIVREQIPSIHLTIHGKGEYYQDLVGLVSRLELDTHVRFSTDYVPTTELPRLIGSADVGVVPNKRNVFTDGILPTKLMEYVALGTPVIAARTPAIAAYFDDNMVKFFEPGNITDLANCIVELYSDRRRLAQLARNSDKFNQRYSWTKVAADYVALVDRLSYE
jgi:glycosyltransferase involved in cell wall biosynthesis